MELHFTNPASSVKRAIESLPRQRTFIHPLNSIAPRMYQENEPESVLQPQTHFQGLGMRKACRSQAFLRPTLRRVQE